MNCRTRTNYDGLIPVPPHRWHLTTLSPFLRVPFPSQFLHGFFFSPALFCMVSSQFRSSGWGLGPLIAMFASGLDAFVASSACKKQRPQRRWDVGWGLIGTRARAPGLSRWGDRSAKHAQQWNCPFLITVQNCTTAFNRLWIKRYNSTFRCRRTGTPSVQFCTDSAPTETVRTDAGCVRSTVVRSAHSVRRVFEASNRTKQ
jgi:hypothetical protein